MKINFYLRPSKTDLKPIKMFIHLNGKREYIHTGHHCREKDWDEKKQRVKGSAKNSVPINKKLGEMEALAFDALSGVNERLVDINFIKNKFVELYAINTRKAIVVQNQFLDLFDEFVKDSATRHNSRGKVLSDHTMAQYQFCRTLLSNFQKEKGYILTFENINADFYSKFRSYLQGKDYSTNSFSHFIKKIKTFLFWCEEREIRVNPKFKSFAAPQHYDDAKPLMGSEVIDLWKKENPHKNLDVFLALVSTGMRLGDYNRVMTDMDKYLHDTPEGKALIFNANKTGKKCVIPFFDDLYFRPVYLYNKYNGKMPKVVRNPFNRWLDFNLKYSVKITSKTGRKTFCSIQYFEQGKEAQYIMASTGHATETEFKKYIGAKADTIIKAHKEKATHLKAL
jgi:hypothetical protein